MSMRLVKDGFYELRTSPGVLDELNRQVEAIAEACGPDYGYTAGEANARLRTARAGVYTETTEAVYDNATNQTLSKNLEAGKHG